MKTARAKKKPNVGDPRSITLSKIDVAAEHIRAAVWLFFEDAHPAPIYLLAASAREITTVLGDKLGVKTVLTEIAENRGLDRAGLIHESHRYAGFMKHADRGAEKKIDLPYSAIETVLQLACHDFGRVTGGMPIEAQVFEAWISAIAFPRISEAPLRQQDLLKRTIAYFPGIRTASPSGRRQIGLKILEKAINDPALEMIFQRDVILPKQESQK